MSACGGFSGIFGLNRVPPSLPQTFCGSATPGQSWFTQWQDRLPREVTPGRWRESCWRESGTVNAVGGVSRMCTPPRAEEFGLLRAPVRGVGCVGAAPPGPRCCSGPGRAGPELCWHCRQEDCLLCRLEQNCQKAAKQNADNKTK